MGRVVVVSGGGTGTGQAVAARFARDAADVVIVGRRADVLDRAAAGIEAQGSGSVHAIAADLTDTDQALRVRDEVVERHGRVDVVVANAGGNVTRQGPPSAHDTGRPELDRLLTVREHWQGNFESNVLTAVLLVEALADVLTDGGRIVLLSSIAAYRGSGNGSYGAAKAALHPYAFDLSSALGPRGITVNVVAPGYVEGTEFFGDGMTDERRERLLRQTHNGRAGTVVDVAETVHWLASPGAGYVTAQVVQVNGGAALGR
ncbi:SDR family NAD(P)-dependent oxidoreductase [Catenuloplanes atrovinosus]|uniref:3-oxoacyl-[acyl-carrier protein] reductase n=1 Tax=Catenuloplanes atrovinosus TaxID=137266 RepID=A0AAE4CE11_9ACTN|nr:SDR family oxidoreductase [Catenuloplanes atrovinosus]MDR7279599.1 3-oxoacyl-[acyl-carrier protein] reductase [Catenuloplanes atrovinosus]